MVLTKVINIEQLVFIMLLNLYDKFAKEKIITNKKEDIVFNKRQFYIIDLQKVIN